MAHHGRQGSASKNRPAISEKATVCAQTCYVQRYRGTVAITIVKQGASVLAHSGPLLCTYLR